jgi:uncharacterized protein
MYARPFIDSLDFAGNGREISGEVPVAELARLQDVLESPQGILSYTVRGGVDNQSSHFLDIRVTGRCRLICQRCLEGLDYPVQIDARLLLRDQASLNAMGAEEHLAGHPEGEEAFDSILADAHLDVLNLLEEEVLLSLPIAPRHEIGTCMAAGSENRQEEERHPFAVLAKLKRN